MDTTTQRFFYYAVGRPFLRGLVSPFLFAVLLVYLADATVDWSALRLRLLSLPPASRTAVFAGLFLAWSLAVGRALRPVWRQPTIAFLVRQPLTRWQWVAGLLPYVGFASLPAIGSWWLAPGYGNPVVHYLGFVGLSWPIILGFSYASPASIVQIGVSTAILAALLFVYWFSSVAAYVACLVSILQLPFSVAPIPRQIRHSHSGKSGHLASAGAVVALFRRDLRCLLRLEWRVLVALALSSVVVALIMLALRVNGDAGGREAFLAGCVLFSIAASLTYEALEKLKLHLGKEVMRHRWPVSYSQRSLALIVLIAALAAPSLILVGAVGSTMGGPFLLLFVLFTAVTVTSCAALFSRSLETNGPTTAIFLLLLTLHNAFVFSLPAWAYAIVAIPVVVLNVSLTSKGLRTFAVNAERNTLAQLA